MDSPPRSSLAAAPLSTKLIAVLGILLIIQAVNTYIVVMFSSPARVTFLTALAALASKGSAVDVSWYAPNATAINNISQVINGTGVYGFIYNSSYPTGVPYGTYNWCNMPHVRKQEYPTASHEFRLSYVELMHRHHKRTVYLSNSFPVESYPWNCDDEGLFFFGRPLSGNQSAQSCWHGYESSINPFKPSGFQGSCQFPQITAGGLDDAWQHGKDLYDVYHHELNFLPRQLNDQISFRVTQNVITSEVAGMVLNGMFATTTDTVLLVQPSGVDSLEPTYTCASSTALYNDEHASDAWTAHLADAQPLYDVLDGISGVDPTDAGWHSSFDHYYDNLSARQCHGKPLPCQIVNGTNSTNCVTEAEAEEVYRLGNWEYSYTYRDDTRSLAASTSSMGVWVAELAQNIREHMAGTSKVIYRHNVAHDGSVSRLLSVLQVDVMVWPGMGAEVVFELFEKPSTKNYYVRVLFGGQIMRSSSPTLGYLDMLPVDTLLSYFDGLVGPQASLIEQLCDN